jgi:hypothetical protein
MGEGYHRLWPSPALWREKVPGRADEGVNASMPIVSRAQNQKRLAVNCKAFEFGLCPQLREHEVVNIELRCIDTCQRDRAVTCNVYNSTGSGVGDSIADS